jgi:hypothetical protein
MTYPSFIVCSSIVRISSKSVRCGVCTNVDISGVQFLREQSYQAHHQTVNITRANLCELIASRVLRRYDEDHEGRFGLLKLANVLVAGFEPFQNAPVDIIREHRTAASWTIRYRLARQEYERMLTALEVR